MCKETEGLEAPTLGHGTKTEKEVGVWFTCRRHPQFFSQGKPGQAMEVILHFPKCSHSLSSLFEWIHHEACLSQGWCQTEILRYALAQCQSCLKMLMQHGIEENWGFYLHGKKS